MIALLISLGGTALLLWGCNALGARLAAAANQLGTEARAARDREAGEKAIRYVCMQDRC